MDCMNCGIDVEEDKAVLSVNVFLCHDCGDAALELRRKVQAGLENTLATLDAGVRTILLHEVALTKEMVDNFTPSKALLFLLAIREAEACQIPPTPSASTKPSAITADGTASSAPPRAQG